MKNWTYTSDLLNMLVLIKLQVLLDITVPELNILDMFEDVEYERTTVDVSLMVLIH